MKFNKVLALAILAATCTQASYAWGGRFANNHPRRAEVLGRDGMERGELNSSYGRLNGHYGQLMREDQGIRQQERFDSRMNGGYITRGEQHQLNREENGLQRQIYRDRSW